MVHVGKYTGRPFEWTWAMGCHKKSFFQRCMSHEQCLRTYSRFGDEIPTPFFLGDFNSKNPGWLGYIGDSILPSYKWGL